MASQDPTIGRLLMSSKSLALTFVVEWCTYYTGSYTYFKPQPLEYKERHRDFWCIRWALLIFTLPTYFTASQNSKEFASGNASHRNELHARKEEYSLQSCVSELCILGFWRLSVIRLFCGASFLQKYDLQRGKKARISKLTRLNALHRDEETNVSSTCF